MTNRLSLLLASTALAVAIGLPALAGMWPAGDGANPCGAGVCASVPDGAHQKMPLIRVSGDDNDEDDEGGWLRRGDDDDCDDDDDDDDDCRAAGGRGNPAPAGTVAPPANGLFGNGAPPVAVTN